MTYLYLKALHIIFVITWFAGLFYIVRLFIYFVEAADKEAEEKNILQKQYKIMMRRLWYGITWPSAVITLVLGISLIWNNTALLTQGWFHLKLAFLVFLLGYHFFCHGMYRKLILDKPHRLTSIKLRIWNELATLFLFAIVFIVILKNTIDWLWALSGIIFLGILLFAAIKIYEKSRKD